MEGGGRKGICLNSVGVRWTGKRVVATAGGRSERKGKELE